MPSSESGPIDEAFVARAVAYIRDQLGKDTQGVGPDSDLIQTGVLDSLGLVSFMVFLEEERGEELAEVPDLSQGFSLRRAHRLVASG